MKGVPIMTMIKIEDAKVGDKIRMEGHRRFVEITAIRQTAKMVVKSTKCINENGEVRHSIDFRHKKGTLVEIEE